MVEWECVVFNFVWIEVCVLKDGIVSQIGCLLVGMIILNGVFVFSLVVSQVVWVEVNFKEIDFNYMVVG